MKVIEYLKTNGIDALQQEYAIKINQYDDHGIMVLNYDQINSPKYEDVAQECRALILENTPPYNVIARSFKRFFTINEGNTADLINFDNVVLWEKLDGSIISLYFHNNEWKCSTRSMAFAEGHCDREQTTVYNDLFWHCFTKSDQLYSLNSLIEMDDVQEYTFVFELTSPLNRVVKIYNESNVTLLAVVHNKSGKELDPLKLKIISERLELPHLAYHKVTSFDDVTHLINTTLTGLDEGFVLADYTDLYNVKRIKFKTESYLAIANLRMNGLISDKNIATLVWNNDYHEYLSVFPEDVKYFLPYINAMSILYNNIISIITNTEIMTLDQKSFALKIKDLPYKSILFSIKKGEKMSAVFNKMTKNAKYNMLNSLKNKIN